MGGHHHAKAFRLLAYTVALAWVGAIPAEAGRSGRGYHRSAEYRAHFYRPYAEQARIRSLCAELLTQARPEPLGSVPVIGAPGLRILPGELNGVRSDYLSLIDTDQLLFERHELVSSARFARMIHEANRETLVLIPEIDSRHIPGFDGVILDAEGQPVANYSVKTLMHAYRERAILDQASSAIKNAKRFSDLKEWLVATHFLVSDELGDHHFDHENMPRRHLRGVKEWLAKSLAVFGVAERVEQARPTRVFIDIRSNDLRLPSQEDLAQVRRWIDRSNGLIESVFFRHGRQMVEVRR